MDTSVLISFSSSFVAVVVAIVSNYLSFRNTKQTLARDGEKQLSEQRFAHNKNRFEIFARACSEFYQSLARAENEYSTEAVTALNAAGYNLVLFVNSPKTVTAIEKAVNAILHRATFEADLAGGMGRAELIKKRAYFYYAGGEKDKYNEEINTLHDAIAYFLCRIDVKELKDKYGVKPDKKDIESLKQKVYNLDTMNGKDQVADQVFCRAIANVYADMERFHAGDFEKLSRYLLKKSRVAKEILKDALLYEQENYNKRYDA
jgi:hypothetical protein